MNKTIFLTGATGLVGGNLISRVLTENPANSLVLLVRANSREEAEGRVARTLSLVSPNLSWENARKRIQVVNGDVSLDKLGLNERDYAATAIATTHIIHSAAAVKFNNPLDLARKMNVVGTKNMITFAKKAQKLGDLHRFAYVSTAYVCGEREGTIVEDELLPVAAFANSYEQAKHEAEALVRLQMHELPITVFRPSIIVGDSQSGRTTAFNVLYFPLRLIHRGLLKFLPGSRNTPADVVPVDYVSDALCHIFLTTEEGIGETFHLTAGEKSVTSAGNVVDSAVEFFNKTGVEKEIPYIKFLPQQMVHLTKGLMSSSIQKALRLMEVYESYLSIRRSFDNSNTRRVLRGTRISPPPYSNYYRTILQYCLACDWGKVAVQTAA